MSDPVVRRRAIASLVAARIVYAVNWLNLGVIFVLMAPELGAGVGGLATVTSTFYLGIGIAQVPGGLLAARWGSKKIVTLGVFISSFAVLGTAVSTMVWEIAVLRFLVGLGMAFVFAPGVVLVARLLRGGSSGLGVGLFNSAFDLGGLFGLFGWVVLATLTGWRPSLALSGGLGVVTGLLVAFYVPNDQEREGFAVRTVMLKKILADKKLILLGLGTLGFTVGNVIIASFMQYYLVSSYGISPSIGGAVAGLVVAVPIFTAIIAGRIYDRSAKPRRLMLFSLLGSGIALLLAAYPSPVAAVACAMVGGVVSGFGYTVAFAGAKDLNRAEPEYDGLAVGWVNCISLSGSFLPPLAYSFVAESLGYPSAWLGSALLTFVFVVPLLMLEEGFRS